MEQQTGWRRLGLRGALAGFLVVAVMTAGGLIAARTFAGHTFSANGLRFPYPAGWHAMSYRDDAGVNRQEIVALSNMAMHEPCTSAQSGGIVSNACTWPVDRLAPDSVVMKWSSASGAGWNLARAQGTPLTLGGLPAKRDVQRPGACGVVGTAETMDVEVALPDSPGNFLVFTACLAGPHLAASQSQVDAMLLSTTITQ
jgi:hypothetical protein